MRLLLLLAMIGVLMGCNARHGVYHIVERGQTLYRISRTYGVDERYLARINGISDPTQLPVGKQLFIPGADRVLTVPPTALSVTPAPQPSPIQTTRPVSPSPVPRASTSPPKASPDSGSLGTAQRAASRPAATKDLFIWPLKGKIVKDFCATGTDPCKGLEIEAPRGTPIMAAAAGHVIYSGDGIRGYGNLIILKHENSFFTVYGYNDRNLVKNGAYVGKGERIALSGSPPGGGLPRLHFEIRFGKKSLDPTFYLP